MEKNRIFYASLHHMNRLILFSLSLLTGIVLKVNSIREKYHSAFTDDHAKLYETTSAGSAKIKWMNAFAK